MSMETFSWKNRNVFVTGITGFLGSHLARALVARGANVVGLIRDRVPVLSCMKIRQTGG